MQRTMGTGALSVVLVALALPSAAFAGPEQDRVAFVEFFQTRFPDIPFEEFANGIYAIDADARYGDMTALLAASWMSASG